MPMAPDDALHLEDPAAADASPGLASHSWIGRGRRVAGVITGFLLGQGSTQAITVLAGLFLVRHLSLAAYAQFGVASSLQAVFSTLMDLGFAGTIVPMVGDQKSDRALLGRYVRSANRLRIRSFWILSPVTVIAYVAIVRRQGWSSTAEILLLASILVALFSGGRFSCFSAPLFLHGELRAFYVPQVFTGALRLGCFVALAAAGQLNAWLAAGLGALTVTANTRLIEAKSRSLMEWPDHEDGATEKKLIKYVLPATPAIIFAAFQGQLTLLLISIFGNSTVYIAQVAALSRIGQIFAVLMTFNYIVVEPYIAKLNHRRLLRTFTLLGGLAALVSVPLVYLAFRWPQLFLYLIGPKYGDLRGLLGWVILAACINYLAGLIWIMNRARQWVFWFGSIIEVALLVGVQIAFVLLVGIRTTREAVFLTLVASVCPLVAHLSVALYGLLRAQPASSLSPQTS